MLLSIARLLKAQLYEIEVNPVELREKLSAYNVMPQNSEERDELCRNLRIYSDNGGVCSTIYYSDNGGVCSTIYKAVRLCNGFTNLSHKYDLITILKECLNANAVIPGFSDISASSWDSMSEFKRYLVRRARIDSLIKALNYFEFGANVASMLKEAKITLSAPELDAVIVAMKLRDPHGSLCRFFERAVMCSDCNISEDTRHKLYNIFKLVAKARDGIVGFYDITSDDWRFMKMKEKNAVRRARADKVITELKWLRKQIH